MADLRERHALPALARACDSRRRHAIPQGLGQHGTLDHRHGNIRCIGALRDALLGFERTIRHFDGHSVVIRHGPTQVASHGQILRLKGEGLPVHGVPSEFGDLFVTLDIAMPKAITQEERAFVERHFIPEKEERLGAEMKPR